MARIHGVNTQYGSELGIYVQRPADDADTFAANWDRIFGKKDKEPAKEEVIEVKDQDNASS